MTWSKKSFLRSVRYMVTEVEVEEVGGVLATDHHRYSAIGWLVYTTIYIR